jgi:hypothetical protein
MFEPACRNHPASRELCRNVRGINEETAFLPGLSAKSPICNVKHSDLVNFNARRPRRRATIKIQ